MGVVFPFCRFFICRKPNCSFNLPKTYFSFSVYAPIFLKKARNERFSEESSLIFNYFPTFSKSFGRSKARFKLPSTTKQNIKKNNFEPNYDSSLINFNSEDYFMHFIPQIFDLNFFVDTFSKTVQSPKKEKK